MVFTGDNDIVKAAVDLLKISRPLAWPIGPILFTIGLSVGRFGLNDPNADIPSIAFIQMLWLSIPFCVYVFGINDLYDLESDRANPRKKALDESWKAVDGVKTEASHHSHIRFASAAVCAVLFATALFSGNTANIFYSIALIVLPFAYSSPPWRLKARAPFDSISMGIVAYLGPFALGFSYVDDAWRLPLQAYVISFCVMGVHAFSTVMDYSVDKRFGDRTFAVVFGKRGASAFAAVAFLAGFMNVQAGLSKCFFALGALMLGLNVIFPSEKLARYTFMFIFVGVLAICLGWLAPFIAARL